MTGLGDRLKEARMAKGFTLDDLQAITKIQKRYLASIESEDYGKMPGSFYVRAFIKQYAEAVGLDADEMLLLYKESPEAVIPKEEEKQLASPTLNRRSSSKRSSELNQAIPKIIVALFVIVIITVVWYLGIKSSSNNKLPEINPEKPITVEDQQKPSDGKGTEVVVGKEAKEDKKEADKKDEDIKDEDKKDEDKSDSETDKPEQTLEHDRVDGEDSKYLLTGANEFKVEIRASGESWIGILDAAKQERMPTGATTMGAGQSVELDASDTDSVRIRVGQYKAVEIYVNGELLEYASELVPQNVIIEYKKEQ